MRVCFECGQYTESATVNEDGQTLTEPLDCDHKKYIYTDRKFKRKDLSEELEYVPSKPVKEVEA
jgi:hypothetical protein